MIANLNKKRMMPYLLVIPVLAFIGIVYGYPLILTFKYSFQKVSLIGDGSEFVGFENYIGLLKDPDFYGTLFLTLRWTALTVVLKIGLGFMLALFLNGKIYMKKVYRVMILIPWAIPQVAVAILWSWILDGKYGYLNYYLERLGYSGEPIAWLSDPTLAFAATSFVDAWIGIPLVAMIFLSGLGGISDSLYEAAKIDGANLLQRFRWVTVPGIKKVFLIATTLTTIWTFNSFNIIYVLTGGGPMGGTEVMTIRIYREAFGKYNLGMSSTLSVMVFVVLTALSVYYWKEINKEEE